MTYELLLFYMYRKRDKDKASCK